MGILEPIYSGSFDGVSFLELSQSGWLHGRPLGTNGTQYSNEGNHTYISMGAKDEPFDLEVGADDAEITALLGKRGDTGTLVWSRGSMTATLLDITPQRAPALSAGNVRLRFFSTAVPDAPGDTSTYMLSDTGAYMLDDAGDYIIVG